MSSTEAEKRFGLFAPILRALRLLRQSWLVCGVMSSVGGGGLLIAGLASGAIVQGLGSDPLAADTNVSVTVGPEQAVYLFAPALAAQLVATALGSVLAAHAAQCDLHGRRVTFVSAWSACWRHALPMLVIQLGIWVVVGLGLILLVIPGLIAAIALGLTPAARVIEGGGIWTSFRQGLRVASGRRWSVGRFLVLGNLVVSAVLWGFLTLYGWFQTTLIDQGAIAPMIFAFLALAVVGFFPYLFGLLPAAAYAQLKALRETPADVFD